MLIVTVSESLRKIIKKENNLLETAFTLSSNRLPNLLLAAGLEPVLSHIYHRITDNFPRILG